MPRILKTLRFRLTMAFLLISLISVFLVGAMARQSLHKNFPQVEQEVAFFEFKTDVAAYIEKYGSWQAGHEIEGFMTFERRRRAVETLIGVRPFLSDCGQDLVEKSGITLEELETADFSLNESIKPPFIFILLDPQGNVLAPPNAEAPENWQQKAEPIEVKGEPVAFALEVYNPNLSTFDRGYIKEMRRALQSGLGISAGIAAALGLVLADRFSRPIHKLTAAAKAMKTQDWQRVDIRGRGEIGELGNAFNDMSDRLRQAYDDLAASREEIRELSIRDELTQLYNRRFFNEQALLLFAQAKRYDSPLSLMIGDIDSFKRINDTLSHQMGDRVLQQVAQLLMRYTRKSDLVARYGGEEFVIIFPETEREHAIQLCDRLRARIEAYDWSRLHPDLSVTMSMGVNGETQLGTIEKMLSIADHKLYAAKQQGRNRVCW